MKCRHCKKEGIPEDAIYCCYCGKVLKRDRDEISVPPPRRKANGMYTGRLMVDGVRVTVPEQSTEAKYYAVARAMKSQLVEVKAAPAKITLEAACNKYTEERSAVLSPSTIYGYKRMAKNRFKAYMTKDIHEINYQAMVNAEAALCGAKTLKNAWGFISSVIEHNGMEAPKIALPQVVKKELPWLDDKQIKVFLEKIKNDNYEIGMLLGLHGLRRSEILAISPSKITNDHIIVEGSKVISVDGMIQKDTNKNQSSRREVPIMIPRLKELVALSDNAPDVPYINDGNALWRHIRDICKAAGLPAVTPHSLRRSFVSLGYSLGWSEHECMLYGGWSDFQTMHNIYIKLSDKDKNEAANSMKNFYSQ